jgi:hypothetical protein
MYGSSARCIGSTRCCTLGTAMVLKMCCNGAENVQQWHCFSMSESSVNLCPKITQLFWLDFIKTYTIMHPQKQSSQDVIGPSYEKSAGIDNVFFLEKSCRKMYTIFSAV